jgi:hypothetical protein
MEIWYSGMESHFAGYRKEYLGRSAVGKQTAPI